MSNSGEHAGYGVDPRLILKPGGSPPPRWWTWSRRPLAAYRIRSRCWIGACPCARSFQTKLPSRNPGHLAASRGKVVKAGEVDHLSAIGQRQHDVGVLFAPVDNLGVIKLPGVDGLRRGFVASAQRHDQGHVPCHQWRRKRSTSHPVAGGRIGIQWARLRATIAEG